MDEVLFVSPQTHKTEPPLPFPLSHIFRERLRFGTKRLLPKLQELGYDVWIYTSSFRSEQYIRWLFRLYGIRLDGIVNGQRHLREVQGKRKEVLPQKMPGRYRITLHVDDETVVVTNGVLYGFNVYQLDAQDDDWEQKIIDRVQKIQEREALLSRQS